MYDWIEWELIIQDKVLRLSLDEIIINRSLIRMYDWIKWELIIQDKV